MTFPLITIKTILPPGRGYKKGCHGKIGQRAYVSKSDF